MMNDKSDENIIIDNRGISLVELIVAIAIGVIVAGAVAALMTFAIRMYRNESVNTEIQYELQTNINSMMDEIMGASVFVVQQNSGVDVHDIGTPYTQYALFGKVTDGVTLVGGGTGQRFDGVIFVSSGSGKFKVFMDRFSQEAAALDIQSVASGRYTSIIGASDQTRYLLGEDLTQFVIEPDPQDTSFDTTNGTYKNPIEIQVELAFEKNGWGTKKYDKHVDDITYLRNKVTEKVYVNGTGYELKKND